MHPWQCQGPRQCRTLSHVMGMMLIARNLVIVSFYRCNNSLSLFALLGPCLRTNFGGNPRHKQHFNKNRIAVVRLVHMQKEAVLLVTLDESSVFVMRRIPSWRPMTLVANSRDVLFSKVIR